MFTVASKYEHRDDKIAVAKGIGIILVVIGHCSNAVETKSICNFIYMFHMPLFFFVSGYFFNLKYIENKKTFVKKRIKGLYVPFIKWNILFILLHNTFFKLYIYSDKYGYDGVLSTFYSWNDILNKILYVIEFGVGGSEQLLGGYWFLPVLFIASILSLFLVFLINKFIGNFKNIYSIFLACLFLIISGIEAYSGFSIWRFNNVIFLSISIYLFGYICKAYSMDAKFDRIFILVMLFVVVLVASFLHPLQMLKIYSFYDTIYYFVVSILGCLLVLCLSKHVTLLKNFLIFVGQNTLTILTWHLLCFKFINLFKIEYYSMDIRKIACYPFIREPHNLYWLMLYSSVGVFIPLILPYLKNYYENRFTNRKKY
jgi:fucose 4-O-acetylase-like acetyltransferase